ncbi:hypothetical protein GCM10009831_20650 [Dietzia cercidiphylli]|uniref:Uncharacterized protein n=1 Tax=Dietzia cercidiphylli TaxID=498199 RepID=A0ABP4US59_9ACTN
MVLPHPKGVDAHLVGQDRLFDDVPDHLSVVDPRASVIDGGVAEGVEAKGDGV